MAEEKGSKGFRGMILHIVLDVIIGNILHILTRIFLFIGTLVIRLTLFAISLIKPIAEAIARFIRSLHHRLGSFFPSNIRQKLGRQIVYAGISRNPEETLGTTLMYALIFPVFVTLIAISLGIPWNMILLTIVVPFIVVWIVLYMFVMLLIERRTESIENLLPDILSMISQNMIAGMTPYNALWTAARPEFGPLAMEIQGVARDTLAGVSLEDALTSMTERVKSLKLDRSVRLMIQGMKSGGELPTVLQEISTDIRVEQNLMSTMRAETAAQAMFIVFAILVGAPLLFASSIQFITIFSTIHSRIDTSSLSAQAGSGVMSIQGLSITPEFYFQYAIITLAVSSLFAALLVGLIRTGKLTSGMTLIPILIVLTTIIFIALNYGFGTFFGDMLAM